MIKNWNIRLRQARQKNNLTLVEVGERIPSALSQQSLLKYEQGKVYPKLDILLELCNLYNVTLDYIIYGEESSIHFNIPNETVLVTLLFLMYKKSITFDNQNKVLLINDNTLKSNIYKLYVYISNKDISTIDDLQVLINAIKKMSKE